MSTAAVPLAEFWYNNGPPTLTLMRSLEHLADDYLVIDLRATEYTPLDANLFYSGEPAVVPAEHFTRFASWPWMTLLFHTQHYRLYRLNFSKYFAWDRQQAPGS